MSKKLKIVSISSELEPFSKTGGLADIARELPIALDTLLGHEVICITPLYGQIIDKTYHQLKLFKPRIKIKIDAKNSVYVNYWQGQINKGLPVYFIENPKYFSQKKLVYGSSHENARFRLFCIAALKLLIILRFKPDVIQCHDWQTGSIPCLLKKDFKNSSILKNTATVFTIHNLTFQMGLDWWTIPVKKRDGGRKTLPAFKDPELEHINFAKRAILNADIINTVSETYAQELLEKDKGQDLHLQLRNRQDRFFGIVNGINQEDYNPATDPGLKANFNYQHIDKKKDNKLFIQKTFGIKVDENLPIITMGSRITHQKGWDIFMPLLDILLKMDLQIMVLGDGNKDYIKQLNKFMKKYPKKIVHIPFNYLGVDMGPKYETSLYAGGDMHLLPSYFEPCGIPHLKAMRYGCVPIVRSVGGLHDTVTNFNPLTGHGNGFTFKAYNPYNLLIAITRALETYKHKNVWRALVTRVMKMSFSWEIPATKYVKLFRKAIKFHKENNIK